jgi:hypothetical protein
MACPAGGSAGLYYDIGQWYNPRDSVHLSIPAGNELRIYRFDIAPGVIRRLRLDVSDRSGTVMVGGLRLTTREGGPVDVFGPESLRPMHDIRDYSVSDGVATVRTGTDNPMLLVDRELQAKTLAALGLRPIGPDTVLFLAAVVLGALVLSVLAAVRLMPGGTPATRTFWGTFLIILGLRLAWLKVYGRPMPYWDEWEMDGVDLLVPLKAHALHWGSLLVPQSEHRTLVSRLITLAGSILGGEWDPRVGMVAGAAMQAASLALLCALAAASRLRLALMVCAGIILIGSFPFDPRNLLCGDQCQMYALNLMTVVVLCLGVSPPSRAATGAAAVASTVSLFTMASGCVAPLLASVLALMRGPREGEGRRGALLHAAVFGAAGLAGLALYRTAPFQEQGYTHSVGAFIPALVARLSWPLAPGVGQMVLVWIPWTLFAGSLAFRRRRPGALEGFVLGLGVWVLANAAALAHGRPYDPSPFDSRYYTSMILVAVCALLSLGILLGERRTLALAAVGFVLSSPLLLSVGSLLARSPEAARAYWQQQSSYDDLIRPYLRTGNRALLYDLPPARLPYWNGAELAAQLDSPLMQPWLPAVLRQSLVDRPGSGFRGAQEPGGVTMACRALMKAGVYLAAAGLILLAAGACPPRRARGTDG